MTIEGVDFANQRPKGAALRAAGKRFVVRYLSPNTTNNPRKELTGAEVREYHGAGLSICVVWETGTSRARLGGYAGGQQDARLAHARLVALNGPTSLPIYFAVDEDTTGPAVEAYFRGVADVIGHARTGAYGGIRPISWLFDNKRISYGWQTYAWSGGHWDSRAQAQQYNNDESIPGAGSGYDLDRATTGDYGQWNPDGTHGDTGVIDMTEVDLTPAALAAIQKAVGDLKVDGAFDAEKAGATATLRGITRQVGYRTDKTTNHQMVDLADAIGKLAAVVAALPTAEAIADAVAAKLGPVGGVTIGALTPAQLAAAERALADVLDPGTGT